jgi:hypothetical protein
VHKVEGEERSLLRDDNGSSIFGDRMKDLLSFLCIRLKEKKEVPY